MNEVLQGNILLASSLGSNCLNTSNYFKTFQVFFFYMNITFMTAKKSHYLSEKLQSMNGRLIYLGLKKINLIFCTILIFSTKLVDVGSGS